MCLGLELNARVKDSCRVKEAHLGDPLQRRQSESDKEEVSTDFEKPGESLFLIVQESKFLLKI